jgi:tRNA (guanine37-N1)-methyltransferase
MQNETAGVRVPKKLGQQAIVLANKLGIVDHELQVWRDNDFIYIPLVNSLPKEKLRSFKEQIKDYEFSPYPFTKQKKRGSSLIELLEGKLPPDLLASLSHAMDLIGDIAIIEIPVELEQHKSLIGQAVLEANKNVQTVLAKAGAISGTYRLREFDVIAGEPKTQTVHKEYGCQFYVDVAKAYFSPRLGHEHNRVASIVKEGETVVDMFSGVGPFAIQIAKAYQNVKVSAIDINPNAVELLRKNIRLNRVQDKVQAILGDARQIVKERLSSVADRVIMNLPEKAMEFVEAACEALKLGGGLIHFYFFTNASESLDNVKLRFAERVEASGRKVKRILFSGLVRETAPFEWQAVLDAEIG